MTPQTFRPFAPNCVKLLPGMFLERFTLNRKYLASLTDENLLRPHHMEAGLWAPAEQPKGIHWGWESPQCQLRGTFIGHWLSAAARIVAITGDAIFKARADYIVSEIARCQQENGGEWAGSIPEKYLDWTTRRKYVWAPQYVLHKQLMGLHDCFTLLGNEQALEICNKWAKWFHRWTGQFSQEQLDTILDVETGGMLEAWADLYGATKKQEYLDLINRYYRRSLFDKLLAGQEALTNMHANTTIPEVQGAARAWEVTGEPRWRQIVEAYWQSAVDARGCYCTGGQTCGEVWTPYGEQSARLGDKNQEHCTVYNMQRLADYLLRWTGDVRYADYWERNLYNGILAQQNPQTGLITYFLPLRPGSNKKWGTPTDDFWCCHGTLVQAQTLHNNGVYFEDDDGLVLAQYVPTELTWKRNGQTVKATLSLDYQKPKTRRPSALAYDLALTCEKPTPFALKLRLPWWLAGEATITINGAAVNAAAITGGSAALSKPSSFVTISRTWHNDKVHIELPKKLYAHPLPDEPGTVAFMDGPVVLAGLVDEERQLVGDAANPETILTSDNEREWGLWKGGWRTRGQARNFRFLPFHEVVDERYTIYFPVK